MTPEQIEIERKAFTEWYGPGHDATIFAAWLARAEKAQRVREALAVIVEHLLDGDEYSALQVARNAGRTALKD